MGNVQFLNRALKALMVCRLGGTLHARIIDTCTVKTLSAALRTRVGRASEKVLSAWLGLALAGTAAFIVAPALFFLQMVAAWIAVAVVAAVPLVLMLAMLGVLWATTYNPN